jgi:glycosyltransferase involved in cell wall biosynthesis
MPGSGLTGRHLERRRGKIDRVPGSVTVAIPTLDAGAEFEATLAAVAAQRVDAEVELLVCDSGSADGTVGRARARGADVIEIPRASFSHGGTRNLLMSQARGEHVAFLTQDAVPEAEDWLARLLAAFALAPEVALAFGPYRPRPQASISVARELTTWFDSFSDGGPRIDALEPARRDAPPRAFLGHLGFFTDANGCVARAAWEEVPFRHIAYAEDHLLAQDMLRAGFAKVYVPEAAVIHSHEYSAWQWMRRSFDEARAVRDVYDWAVNPRDAALGLRGNVMADWRWVRGASAGRDRLGAREAVSVMSASLGHHGARTMGGLLGSHSHRLPARIAARLSLEARA